MRQFIRYSVLSLFILSSVYLSADVPRDRKPTEFYFARLQYPGIHDDSYLKNYYTDWPNMDEHLVQILNRVTNIRADTVVVKVTPDIYKFPLLYTVEPEQINFDDRQIALMREWSARGGFWFADDFHGDEDLKPFEEMLRRIWPDIVRIELTPKDDIFHIFYDIDKFEQVVNDSINDCRPECEQWENGPSGKEPKFFAYYTGAGTAKNPQDAYQIRVLAAFNNDLGDGIEWMSEPGYPFEMSVFSLKSCVDVIIYALTH